MSKYLDYLADVQDVQNVINDLALNMYKQGRADERAKVVEEFREYLKTVTPCEMPQDIWNIGVDNTCDQMLKENRNQTQ